MKFVLPPGSPPYWVRNLAETSSLFSRFSFRDFFAPLALRRQRSHKEGLMFMLKRI